MSQVTSLKDVVGEDRILALTQTIISLGVSLDNADLQQVLSEIVSGDRLHEKYRSEIAALIEPLIATQTVDPVALAQALSPLLQAVTIKPGILEIESTAKLSGNQTVATIDRDQLAKIEGLFRTEIAQITNVDLDGLAELMSGSAILPALPEWQKLVGASLVGLTIGVSVIGAAVNFWLLPISIQNHRLQDSSNLQYLESKEGQMFRQIVKLNSGYLDASKCQKDAKDRNLFLTKDKQKIERVCVLLMP
jgi:hypothetical protein